MWKYVFLTSYVGRAYCGWQRQNEFPSVQETLESVLARITGEAPSVVGSGRTDSGVHAVGQVGHFVLKVKEWDSQVLIRALNGLLPSDIQVLSLQRVSIDFHAQRSALQKQYSYYFQQGPAAVPVLEPYSWWIRKKLDIDAMNQGLQYLLGENDFKPFQAAGSKPGPTVRRLIEAEVSFEASIGFMRVHQTGLVRVRVVGSGFLKQMVRGIAGTLLQVGEGRRPSECFREILAHQSRAEVGPTAPARALWLERVWYPPSYELAWQVEP
jgi:tRNA pseudouridine38-40 synthase